MWARLLVAIALPCVAGFSYSPLGFRPTSGQISSLCRQNVDGIRPVVAASQARLRSSLLNLKATSASDWARFERVKFQGDMAVYTEEADGLSVGVMQAVKPLTPEFPYFEVTIVDGGTQSWIGVGIADTGYTLDKQPGWDEVSVGYHADDGSWYKTPVVDDKSKSGKPQAMSLTGKTFECTNGDVMGVGLEFDDRGKVYNGNAVTLCLAARVF